jgi:hypothetical protein
MRAPRGSARQMHQVQYETLVEDFESEARKLIAFLGLAREPGCLDFHKAAGGAHREHLAGAAAALSKFGRGMRRPAPAQPILLDCFAYRCIAALMADRLFFGYFTIDTGLQCREMKQTDHAEPGDVVVSWAGGESAVAALRNVGKVVRVAIKDLRPMGERRPKLSFPILLNERDGTPPSR